jgi:hypothetical protein
MVARVVRTQVDCVACVSQFVMQCTHPPNRAALDDDDSCGYMGTLALTAGIALSNAALLRCMTAERIIGGCLFSLSSLAAVIATLIFVERHTSALHSNYADYENTYKPSHHGALFGAAGAHSILLMSYFWLISLALNFVACLATLRTCALNKLYPDYAKEVGDLRAARVSVANMSDSWSDSSLMGGATFSAEQDNNA